jgi:Flp pilus assembly protein TadG
MRERRRGSAAIEFAITYAAVLLPLTFGLIFTSQLLWVWHSVNDWTRQGAGYAATHCWHAAADNVTGFMQQNVPPLIGQDQFVTGPAKIVVTYSANDGTGQLVPFSCDSECSLSCIPDTVSVTVTNYQFNSFVSFLGLPPITIPDFQTSQPMESAGCDPEQLACLP